MVDKRSRRSRRDGPDLGDILRDARREAGDSLKSSAPELGVTYTYLSKIENGLARPSSELISRLANRYGIDPDTLFSAAGKLPPDVERIVRERPREAADLLRRHLGHGRA